MNNWQQEIYQDRVDRIKSINFCISNPENDKGLSSTNGYVSGGDLKKGLETYLLNIKQEAKNSSEKSESVLNTKSLKQEIDTISEIISKIDVNKEYRMPESILKKL